MEKVKKAVAIDGPTYLHIYSACPTGWRSPTDTAVRIGRLAVLSGIFPLYEIENGKWKLSLDVEKLIPVAEYFKSQGRFRHLGEKDIEYIQKHIIEEYERIKEECRRSA
jgi:pyruvate ferredoxin oxidoreductase beta subunit